MIGNLLESPFTPFLCRGRRLLSEGNEAGDQAAEEQYRFFHGSVYDGLGKMTAIITPVISFGDDIGNQLESIYSKSVRPIPIHLSARYTVFSSLPKPPGDPSSVFYPPTQWSRKRFSVSA